MLARAPRALVEAGNDAADAADAAPGAWTPVLQNLDGPLLGIWATSERDIWAVGGPLGNAGFEALVVRYDGSAWKRMPAGGTSGFWWVHGTSASDVWMVGEKGRITHWDGTRFEERSSGTTATLFGVSRDRQQRAREVARLSPRGAWRACGRSR